jgi:hypothetical protein
MNCEKHRRGLVERAISLDSADAVASGGAAGDNLEKRNRSIPTMTDAEKQKREAEQKQKDSNILAHFIDVVGLIQRSSWIKHKLTVGISDPADTSLPTHEAFVFVAVYFRQLLAGDKLLGNAKNTYGKLSSSPDRVRIVNTESKTVTDAWDAVPQSLSIASHVPGQPKVASLPKLSDLFECFMYGAHVFHSHAPDTAASAARLSAHLKNYPPQTLLGHLNGGLKQVVGPLTAISAIVYQDFNALQAQHGLPAPDVYWQNQLFNTPS